MINQLNKKNKFSTTSNQDYLVKYEETAAARGAFLEELHEKILGAGGAGKQKKEKVPSNLDLDGAREMLPAGCVLFHDTGDQRIRVFVGEQRLSTGCRLAGQTTVSSACKYLVEWAWRLTHKTTGLPVPFGV